jgi:hypothetical protein
VPTNRSKGMTQLGVDIPNELSARLRDYCHSRGSKLADEVRLAIRRHLDYPPADTSPPLPDAARPRVGRPRKGAAESSAKARGTRERG